MNPLSLIRRRKRDTTAQDGRTADERQAEFLRKHEERMRRVDDALDAVKGSSHPNTKEPAGV